MARVGDVSNLSPAAKRLVALQDESFLCVITGDFKGFKSAQRKYAAEALKHKDVLGDLPKVKKDVPLLSKWGLNFMKVWFLNLFRRLSPEEKELILWGRKQNLARKYKINRMM